MESIVILGHRVDLAHNAAHELVRLLVVLRIREPTDDSRDVHGPTATNAHRCFTCASPRFRRPSTLASMSLRAVSWAILNTRFKISSFPYTSTRLQSPFCASVRAKLVARFA